MASALLLVTHRWENMVAKVTDCKVACAIEDISVCEHPYYVSFIRIWRTLTDEQFLEFLHRAIEIDGNASKLASVWDQVQERLVNLDGMEDEFLNGIIAKIKVIDELRLPHLMYAPLDVQLAVLGSLEPLPHTKTHEREWWDQPVPAMTLVVWVLYQLGEEAGKVLLQEIMPKFANVHIVSIYRAIRKCVREYKDRQNSSWLLGIAKEQLKEAGYLIKVIQLITYRNRLQPCCIVGKCKDGRQLRYVRRQVPYSYHPSENEEVMFAKQGSMLVSDYSSIIIATEFFPTF